MNYNLPHHFAPPQSRSPQEADDWEPGGMTYSTSPVVYNVTAPPTTSQHWNQQTSSPMDTSYSSGAFYQQTSQPGHHYGHASYAGGYSSSYSSTLPPPQPSPYSRGLQLEDYHYRRASYTLSPTTSNASPGWDPSTATGPSYSGYPFDAQQAGSESGSSEDRDPSPPSDNGTRAAPASNANANASRSAKEKRFVCYRVVRSTNKTCAKAFRRKADLQRHESCVHDKDLMERIDCTVKKCNRKGENGFLRRDHLTEHLRNFHSKDIPKKHRRSVSNRVDAGEEEDDADDAQQLRQTQTQPQFFNA